MEDLSQIHMFNKQNKSSARFENLHSFLKFEVKYKLIRLALNYAHIWNPVHCDQAVLCVHKRGKIRKTEGGESAWSVFTLQSTNLLLTFSMA